MASTRKYEGPACYVGNDHDAADGRPLKGGWHYSIVKGPDGVDMPGEPLVLLDDGGYRFAQARDESHRDRFHQRLTIVAPGGGIGVPHTDEEYDATHRHLDELEARLDREGLHPHEHDHVLHTAQEIRVVRGWLQDAQEAKRR